MQGVPGGLFGVWLTAERATVAWRSTPQVVAPDAHTGSTIHKMKRAWSTCFHRVLRGNTVSFNSVLHAAMHNRVIATALQHGYLWPAPVFLLDSVHRKWPWSPPHGHCLEAQRRCDLCRVRFRRCDHSRRFLNFERSGICSLPSPGAMGAARTPESPALRCSTFLGDDSGGWVEPSRKPITARQPPCDGTRGEMTGFAPLNPSYKRATRAA
jgi:hypothetical protein